jgi:hypothetical protein
VDATKGEDGSLSILLSPKVTEKLEALIKDVPPCPGKPGKMRKRQGHGPSCGLQRLGELVQEDPELRETFGDQLTHDVAHELDFDEGYVGMPSEVPGNRPGGGLPGDDEGFVDGSESGSEAGSDVGGDVGAGLEEGISFVSAEEAAGVGAVGAGGITVASFLAYVWKVAQEEGGKVAPVYAIPASKITTISRTNTPATETSTASDCPTTLVSSPK